MIGEIARYRVFTIVDRPDDTAYWLNIGLAFPHKDGKGFNLRLQALPLRGRLAVRAFDEDPNANGQGAKEGAFDEKE